MSNQLAFDPPDIDVIVKRFPAVKVQQPIGDIYVASVDYKSIQKLTYFDVRRVLRDHRDIEQYLGIQRPLSERRVIELGRYVNYVDSAFPTSIIVAVDSDYAQYDPVTHEIVISNCRVGETVPSIAISNLGRVIDGQHRIAGLEHYQEKDGKPFDVIVSFFVGSDIADQAYVFATVNLEQTKVNKSLAYDLFELARSRSPLKTCHNVAVALDVLEGSPFYRRIKRLGVSTEDRGANETLTQATFVSGLVGYISRDPKQDRDDILRNKKLREIGAEESKELVFRNLFIRGDDKLIGRVFEEYFSAVRDTWEEAWTHTAGGIMLSRTNGYRAFASIFGRVYCSVASPGVFVGRERFAERFSHVPLTWSDFNTDRFKPGTSGEAELRRVLVTSLFPLAG